MSMAAGAPRPYRAELRLQEQTMTEADKLKKQVEARKKWARAKVANELKNSKQNLAKIQESWLKIMRSGKTKQLKKEVEIISQNHERDVDRKDAILQMLDRDLYEAAKQLKKEVEIIS